MAGVVTVWLLGGTLAFAQTAPSWNRIGKGQLLTITETTVPNTYDLTPSWRIALEGASSAPEDLSADLELHINGVLHSTHGMPALVSWNSGGSAACTGAPLGQVCGSASLNGVAVDLVCDAGLCTTPPMDLTIPAVPLSSGDEILILVRPASGLQPDAQPDDDGGGLLFGSWNRRLEGLSVHPVPGGRADLKELDVEWAMEFSASATLGVDMTPSADGSCCDEACACPPRRKGKKRKPREIVVVGCCYGQTGSDGVAGITAVPGPGDPCGHVIFDDMTMVELTVDPQTNACTSPPFADLVFDNVTAPPGDVITVTLVPAPGALPELPSIPDDDQGSVEVPPVAPALPGWGHALSALLLGALAIPVLMRVYRTREA
ncbi:MAG: hypothetical protein D6788_05290 [Planctomycetota bacterium]|nr:MAG: hypothetical protein D6788_05290 [Planctomycetota bacterium]